MNSSKLATLLLILVSSTSCDYNDFFPSAVEARKLQIQAQNGEIESLNLKISNLNNQIREKDMQILTIQSEVAKLKQTDVHMWHESVKKEKNQDLIGALDLLSSLKEKYPSSSFMAHVNKKIEELNKKTEEIRLTEEKKFKELTEKIVKQTATDGKKSLEEFQKYYPNSKKADDLKRMIASIDERFLEENKIIENIKKLGVEISEFRSYWTYTDGSRQGEKIRVPYFRFKFKNVSGKSIGKLMFKAVFYDPKNKEQLGEGSHYLIGYGDTPLESGFTKEVFFGSNTGYKINLAVASYVGVIITEDLYGDLYVETKDTEGPIKIGTFYVDKVFKD